MRDIQRVEGDDSWRRVSAALSASAAEARNAQDLLILSVAAAAAGQYADAQEDGRFQAVLTQIAAPVPRDP